MGHRQPRRPAGIPTGGQFAPTDRPEAVGIALVDDDGPCSPLDTDDAAEPFGIDELVPQANSVSKIAAVLDAVAAGCVEAGDIAEAIGVSVRQGAHYPHAAEALGLQLLAEAGGRVAGVGPVVRGVQVDELTLGRGERGEVPMLDGHPLERGGAPAQVLHLHHLRSVGGPERDLELVRLVHPVDAVEAGLVGDYPAFRPVDNPRASSVARISSSVSIAA